MNSFKIISLCNYVITNHDGGKRMQEVSILDR